MTTRLPFQLKSMKVIEFPTYSEVSKIDLFSHYKLKDFSSDSIHCLPCRNNPTLKVCIFFLKESQMNPNKLSKEHKICSLSNHDEKLSSN